MAKFVKCDYCEELLSKKEAQYINGRPYCDNCVREFDFEGEDEDDEDDDDEDDEDDDDDDDDDDYNDYWMYLNLIINNMH